ncbi:hypothetical protein GS399_13215 [Pedobacter sp. HMF7647]|uniref:DUF4350 domain-containing protein n=1 Tax=Hufsiella arboris TaxID=2695275 RepID=A0A7K1YBH9_9SPHI|nr:hypothetical protein [Hufsiella arboris]MXV51936.1 hypothetical protein [Hufsiella arboris]
MKTLSKTKLFLVILLSIGGSVSAQDLPDTDYHTKIASPAYKDKKGPLILFDEGHGNPVSLKNNYSGFNKLLSDDGYLLTSAKTAVSKNMLSDAKIYVSVNALSNPAIWSLPTSSAYTSDEIKTLNEWVKNGGSLFLVTDHFPCGGSVNLLAQTFGFNIINGYAKRDDRKTEIFSLKTGNLLKSVITQTPGKVIDSIRIWGGTAFVPPQPAQILTTLGSGYTVYLPAKEEDMNWPIVDSVPRISGLGLADGAFMKYGKGRLVIFCDGAGFTAQIEGTKDTKRGFNHPDAHQNVQFLLNLIHWLDKGTVN